jgi:hypothetical protein
VDYKTIQEFLTEKNFHFIIFYTKADKSVIAVTRHVPGNNAAREINVALQEIDYDVISVKQMTAKCLTPDGEATHTHTSPST